MRTIHELLVIMRDNGETIITSGLCHLCDQLWMKGYIDVLESNILDEYIKHHKPTKRSKFYNEISSRTWYYWPIRNWSFRLAWLNYHIKITKNKTS